MLDIYGTLEIGNVLEEVASFSRSELAKQKIASLKMLASREEVESSLALVNEMMSILLRHGSLPIDTSFDISKYVEIASKGGMLTALDLDHIATDINTANKLEDYFRKAERSLYPLLNALSNNLYDLTSLEVEIHRVIAPNLSIKDDASPELSSIRRNILLKERKVREMSHSLISHYQDYLSENTITIRNDHFVLPVLSTMKHKVPGIIHDVSDSGQTTFIEPSQLVELSNDIYVLKCNEKEEIAKLLKMLSMKVVVSGPQLISNNKIISELDFICAKAMYGNIHNCNVAHIEKEPTIDLVGARHPLIKSDVVIANDFKLNHEQRIIIISGPNAGGKTVALKTLGLMVMMNQMGMAIPTKISANLSYFPRIYADIGDNQSLSDNLSTFAAHVSNLSTITHFVTHKDLVLLDELGTGTSPNEGEALALAVTDYLLNKKCFALISSHFEAMKEYAYRRENVSNAMMVFDEQKLAPTYTLKIGYPGRSYGLEMARRYHLDEEVIKEAKENLSKNKKRDVNDVIDKLNKVLRQNERLAEELKEKARLLEGKEKDLKHQAKVIENKKENFLSDVEEERQRLIDEAIDKINEQLKVLNNPNAKPHELIKAKTALNNLEFSTDEDIKIEEDIKVNDYVLIDGLGLIGRVTSIKGNKIELISSTGMAIKSTIDKVSKTNEPVERRIRTSNVDELVKIKSDVKLELNIIGEHIDEGIEKLSKYLDDARLRHFHEVRIIHGMGSGALRSAVWEYLKKCDFVSDYHYGGTYDGGTGATIVTLK